MRCHLTTNTLPHVLKIVTFLHVLIHYIHNHVFFYVMSLMLLTKRLWDSNIDLSSCYGDVTTFSGGECNRGTHKKFQCHLHFVTCACRPSNGGCKVLIGPCWGDVNANWLWYLWCHKCYKKARSCVQHPEWVYTWFRSQPHLWYRNPQVTMICHVHCEWVLYYKQSKQQ